jgi:hypothetical protein
MRADATNGVESVLGRRGWVPPPQTGTPALRNFDAPGPREKPTRVRASSTPRERHDDNVSLRPSDRHRGRRSDAFRTDQELTKAPVKPASRQGFRSDRLPAQRKVVRSARDIDSRAAPPRSSPVTLGHHPNGRSAAAGDCLRREGMEAGARRGGATPRIGTPAIVRNQGAPPRAKPETNCAS